MPSLVVSLFVRRRLDFHLLANQITWRRQNAGPSLPPAHHTAPNTISLSSHFDDDGGGGPAHLLFNLHERRRERLDDQGVVSRDPERWRRRAEEGGWGNCHLCSPPPSPTPRDARRFSHSRRHLISNPTRMPLDTRYARRAASFFLLRSPDETRDIPHSAPALHFACGPLLSCSAIGRKEAYPSERGPSSQHSSTRLSICAEVREELRDLTLTHTATERTNEQLSRSRKPSERPTHRVSKQSSSFSSLRDGAASERGFFILIPSSYSRL